MTVCALIHDLLEIMMETGPNAEVLLVQNNGDGTFQYQRPFCFPRYDDGKIGIQGYGAISQDGEFND